MSGDQSASLSNDSSEFCIRFECGTLFRAIKIIESSMLYTVSIDVNHKTFSQTKDCLHRF